MLCLKLTSLKTQRWPRSPSKNKTKSKKKSLKEKEGILGKSKKGKPKSPKRQRNPKRQRGPPKRQRKLWGQNRKFNNILRNWRKLSMRIKKRRSFFKTKRKSVRKHKGSRKIVKKDRKIDIIGVLFWKLLMRFWEVKIKRKNNLKKLRVKNNLKNKREKGNKVKIRRRKGKKLKKNYDKTLNRKN